MNALKKKRTKTKLPSVAIVAMTAGGIVLLAVGGIGIKDYIIAVNQGDTVPDQRTVTTVSEQPSEKKPDNDEPYTVPANQPRTLRIPSLDVMSYIQRVGVDDTGAMATPNNIYFTGWYVDGPAPGEPGVSILNGHVGGRYSPGIFKDLKSLKTGHIFQVEMGDRTLREFEVVSVKTYTLEASAKPLFDDDPAIDRELHLITCDGAYDGASQTYDKRAIVVAKFVG